MSYTPSGQAADRRQRTDIALRVVHIEQPSQNIRRFVFSDETEVLTAANESDYLKMHFPVQEGGNSAAETRTRSYTLREVDEECHQVTIDFVCHNTGVHGNGPAAAWAARAQAGDTIAAFGPGPGKHIDTDRDWFLVAGDMTSLPAISVHLKNLPADARGYAIIEIADENDRQPLQLPDGIELEWVINSNHADSASVMRSRLAEKPWLEGAYYVWIASEFSVARTLRTFLQEQRDMQKGQYYISSYWKLGDTDEGNKKAKKADGGF